MTNENQAIQNDLETSLTTVSVRFTNIKYFSETEHAVKETRLMGKISASEAKKYVKQLDNSNVYISKATETETFEVSTVALYQLKQA